ncbi:MAG: 4-hydroxyphenylpyruvate dioxygenase [Bdellovibrionota bacterium]
MSIGSKAAQAGQENKKEVDFLPLLGTDHIEFYVGNAKQAAYFYQHAFGFQPIAYAGPETGVREKASYVLQQGKIRLVFTTSLVADSEISKHVEKHGDGVKSLCLTVDDAMKAYRETVKLRGAKSLGEPVLLSDEAGEVLVATIQTYGDTVHKFVERKKYKGAFLPGYQAWSGSGAQVEDVGLQYVDHCVGNVELGKMDEWVEFYQKVMGFDLLVTFDDEDISTEYTSLMSKVVSNGNGFVKFPINEPAAGKKKSQIDEFLDFYKGPGVQHIAMATDDIVHTVSELRRRGIEFLVVPEAYYADLTSRVGEIKEDVEELKKLNILVDRDEEGYLLQIFTRPVEDRPTLFFEIIQRRGAKSFGKGNFKALFEAIEREQGRRGNL